MQKQLDTLNTMHIKMTKKIKQQYGDLKNIPDSSTKTRKKITKRRADYFKDKYEQDKLRELDEEEDMELIWGGHEYLNEKYYNNESDEDSIKQQYGDLKCVTKNKYPTML